MNQGIQISFIVCTYKRKKKLQRAVDSIKSNILNNHEIIIVDDSSEFEGEHIAKDFNCTYLSKGQHRRGLASSRNLGLKAASGEYVIFLDDDDYYFIKDPFSKAMKSGAKFIVSNYLEELGDNRARNVITNDNSIEEMLVCNRYPVGSWAIKRHSIQQGFDEDLPSHEDWDFLLKNADLWNKHHTGLHSIIIDKTENHTNKSHQGRTRDRFWLDFLTIYNKFPAPSLAKERSHMLGALGISVDPIQLEFECQYNQRNLLEEGA